ncbi:hypothetical protein IT575_12410 [bacterium]|nr:hypothetical protein [bacterium]
MSCLRPGLLLLVAACLGALLASPPVSAQQDSAAGAAPAGAGYQPSPADQSCAQLLVQARSALERLDGRDGELEAVDRETAFNTALEALSGLHQLHGCEWALEPLLKLRGRPDCPEMHLGWSQDGRISLMLQRLELKNPAYENYTIFLCVLGSNSALSLEGPLREPLAVFLQDGSKVLAEPLSAEHPLYGNLRRLESTFVPQGPLLPMGGLSFKQIIALPDLKPAQISRVESAWGEYRITVPYPENGGAD